MKTVSGVYVTYLPFIFSGISFLKLLVQQEDKFNKIKNKESFNLFLLAQMN